MSFSSGRDVGVLQAETRERLKADGVEVPAPAVVTQQEAVGSEAATETEVEVVKEDEPPSKETNLQAAIGGTSIPLAGLPDEALKDVAANAGVETTGRSRGEVIADLEAKGITNVPVAPPAGV